jgi:hypothetical protein
MGTTAFICTNFLSTDVVDFFAVPFFAGVKRIGGSFPSDD